MYYNFWFNNIQQSGAGTLDEIYHTADDIAIRAGFTSNSTKEFVGCQNVHSYFEYATNPSATSPPNKGLSTFGDTNRGFDFEGNTQVDKFSKKGALIFDFNSQSADYGDDALGSQVIPLRRENIFVSARALDVSSSADGILVVDNPSIFNSDVSLFLTFLIFNPFTFFGSSSPITSSTTESQIISIFLLQHFLHQQLQLFYL